MSEPEKKKSPQKEQQAKKNQASKQPAKDSAFCRCKSCTKIALSGNKMLEKTYYWLTGYQNKSKAE